MHRTEASSTVGVIQPHIFEPDADSQEEEAELLVQGRLKVNLSRQSVQFLEC